MPYLCDGTDEPEISVLASVCAALEDRIETLTRKEHYLIHLDINDFSKFYNEFGPEQRGGVIRGIHWYFNQLADMTKIQYYDRVLHDQYVILTDDRDLGKMIKDSIETETFPKIKPDLDNAYNGLDPQRIKVHLGIISFFPSDTVNVTTMLDRLLDVTKEAKAENPQIKYERWQ